VRIQVCLEARLSTSPSSVEGSFLSSLIIAPLKKKALNSFQKLEDSDQTTASQNPKNYILKLRLAVITSQPASSAADVASHVTVYNPEVQYKMMTKMTITKTTQTTPAVVVAMAVAAAAVVTVAVAEVVVVAAAIVVVVVMVVWWWWWWW
jgi:hypothetical protein